MVNAIPEGYRRVTPYLIVDGASDAIDFYTSVFGATERMRMGGPEGKVGHAELEIGDTVIMLADEHPESNARGPRSVGGTPVSLHIYVEDQFYGDRLGSFEDPFGHHWHVATHVEDVSPEEMSKRMAAQGGG